jgi:(S)-citramalyl-CoA lyase
MSAFSLTSLLFVPGSRPDRFAKALASDASMTCIDLEDAVPAAEKGPARTAAVAAIAPRAAIRINGVKTRDGLADLLALADAPALPPLVLVPMVESADELAVVTGTLGKGAAIVPLIETTRALRNADRIAAAPGVVAMMFGGGDLAAELGVALAWEPLAVARGLFVMACAGAGVPAIDVPFIALDDPSGLAEECRRARALGFQAKAAIHPAQLDAINPAFRPSPAELAEAREALDAFDAAGGGAIRFGGRMLEAPVVARYRKIIALAGEQREGVDA